MINQKYTRVFNTEHRPVETAALFGDEGIAAVFVKEGTDTVVKPSTGAPGELFAGLSLSRNAPPTFLPYVSEGSIDVATPTELPRVPLAGQIMVAIDGTKATIRAGAPTAAGEVQVDGTDLVFHADDDGKPYKVQMLYEPTVTEARAIKGDAPIGGLSSTAQGVIGLVTRGDVSTSYYDASVDWSSVIGGVKLGPNGKLTVGGTGGDVPVTVLSAPSAANPTLVIKL